jgi:hypothetical protein
MSVETSRDQPERGCLPIPDRPYSGLVTYDAKDEDTAFPPIVPLRPPAGAPNVLVVLLDDVGFGAASAFGGPVATPTAERLAAGGLSYNRFHTTALCAPTRAALLSGRNHHAVGMGTITELATQAPGYNSLRPNTAAPLAEILKLNGYSTAQFGKCHEVPVWQSSPMGPFDAWPTGGGGFEHFYGFIGGETNQYAPAIYRDTVPVEPDRTPEEGYHFTEDMTDRAIEWVRQQKALMADKPFFVYFAPGATHAPHHVPTEWADKYKGRFDDGWDALRERTFARQKRLGVVPADAELTARPSEIPAWADMPDAAAPESVWALLTDAPTWVTWAAVCREAVVESGHGLGEIRRFRLAPVPGLAWPRLIVRERTTLFERPHHLGLRDARRPAGHHRLHGARDVGRHGRWRHRHRLARQLRIEDPRARPGPTRQA